MHSPCSLFSNGGSHIVISDSMTCRVLDRFELHCVQKFDESSMILIKTYITDLLSRFFVTEIP